ncbi:Hypothetical_protein [Hexamita inflata]|uniref:Hypothetical_protein n=1 Tax=Hexamita inflata TaxID=28002 RepID=A0AA86U0F6_9EUKA|nr:Hypothetical protein HINF_LOCUS21422 [Hexamita inflata]
MPALKGFIQKDLFNSDSKLQFSTQSYFYIDIQTHLLQTRTQAVEFQISLNEFTTNIKQRIIKNYSSIMRFINQYEFYQAIFSLNQMDTRRCTQNFSGQCICLSVQL